MTESDIDLVTDWQRRDHVRAWWGELLTAEEVAAKYVPRIRGESPTDMFIVVAEGRNVGMIQRYRSADHPDYASSFAASGIDASASAGIDYLIGDMENTRRGLGASMIASFTELLFVDMADIARIIVTPQSANIASCRALEKAGYERRWTGMLDSDDPSDAGEAALYVLDRTRWALIAGPDSAPHRQGPAARPDGQG